MFKYLSKKIKKRAEEKKIQNAEKMRDILVNENCENQQLIEEQLKKLDELIEKSQSKIIKLK